MQLTLPPTVIADMRPEDDYIVRDLDPGVDIGRIMLTGFPGDVHRWNWYLQAPNPFESGTKDSLEEAKCAFRAVWERRKRTMPAGELDRQKQWQETEGRRREKKPCATSTA